MLALAERFPARLGIDELCELTGERIDDFSDEDRDAVADTLAACHEAKVTQIGITVELATAMRSLERK